MELHEARITGTAQHDLEYAPVTLMPLGDIQYGPEACDVNRLRRYIQWGIEHDAWYLGMGDMVDVMSPSNRLRYQQAVFYDSTRKEMDEKAESRIQELLEILAPTKNRWLGLLEGHHWHPFSEGDTSDTRLAKGLGAPFLGNCAFVRLRWKRPSKGGNGPTQSVIIWAHHGNAGGQLLSTPINQLQRLAGSFTANIYLVGHHHKMVAGILDNVSMSQQNTALEHRTLLLACTGSFLRGYMERSTFEGRASGTYVEKKMLAPSHLGALALHIQPVTVNGKPRLHINPELNPVL